jgi:phosphatidylinositol alpha-1,6-mannosyltransferase
VNEKLKIIYVSHLHPPRNAPLKNIGGMQRVSLQLVETLRIRSDVHIKTIGLETSWQMIELKTGWFLFDLFVHLPVIVQKEKPDVILFSSMVTAALAPFIKSRVDVPMVTINHGQDVTLPIGIYQWYIKKVFAALDGVISVSSATRDACLERGLHPAKSIALPNGFIPHGHYLSSPRQDHRAVLSELTGKDLTNSNILLTTGRLVLRKGHEWFINEVLPKIESNVDYVILGDGPEMKNIVKAAVLSEKSESVHIVGRKPDHILHAAYHAADLFIMPNIRVAGDMEGFGIVMLEANIAGTPVVASNLEGIRDVISDGINGFKIEPGDAVGFANRIDSLLQSNRDELNDSSKKFVASTFSWEFVAQRYVDYINQVIKHRILYDSQSFE